MDKRYGEIFKSVESAVRGKRCLPRNSNGPGGKPRIKNIIQILCREGPGDSLTPSLYRVLTLT